MRRKRDDGVLLSDLLKLVREKDHSGKVPLHLAIEAVLLGGKISTDTSAPIKLLLGIEAELIEQECAEREVRPIGSNESAHLDSSAKSEVFDLDSMSLLVSAPHFAASSHLGFECDYVESK